MTELTDTDGPGSHEPLSEETLSESVRALEDIVAEVKALRTSNSKLRRLLGVVALVAIFAAGSAVISFVANREAQHAARVSGAAADLAQEQADANRETLLVTCEATNESRANTIAVWETFVRIVSPETTRTPETQAKVDELLGFVESTYKPRDCEA